MSLWKKNKKTTVVALPKPEAEKPARTLAEIQQQYGQFVAELGQKYYHIKCLQDEIEFLVRTVRDLNQEAAQVKQQEAAKEVEPTKESADAPST